MSLIVSETFDTAADRLAAYGHELTFQDHPTLGRLFIYVHNIPGRFYHVPFMNFEHLPLIEAEIVKKYLTPENLVNHIPQPS